MKLSVNLDEKTAKAFQAIKEDFGFHDNASVIGLMIRHEEDRIRESRRKRIFLPNEIYDKAEAIAKARGQTIEEYIDEVAEEMLEKAKESVKHGEKKSPD